MTNEFGTKSYYDRKVTWKYKYNIWAITISNSCAQLRHGETNFKERDNFFFFEFQILKN